MANIKIPRKKSQASKSVTQKRRAGKTTNTPKGQRGIRPVRYFRWVVILIFISATSYGLYLNSTITDLFEGRIWQLPARVYARPLDLYVGKKIAAGQLEAELQRLGYARVGQLPGQSGEYHHWDSTFEIGAREFEFWDGKEPARKVRIDIRNSEVIRLDNLYTSKEIPLIRLDPVYLTGIFPSHGEDRILLRLEDVPATFLKMLILVEDRRFYEHMGIDPRAIARAFVANLRAGRTVQGGSTITQQLVKNLFLTPSQNIWRKITEAIMALLLEINYDKRQILETYINEIYLGQDHERAIHGFGLASMYYFGKSLQQLSYDEMAMLIGMAKGATFYSPTRNPERARNRRNSVIDTMLDHGEITAGQADVLSSRALRVQRQSKRDSYPAFIDLVKRQLRYSYNSDDLKSEGLQIFTTLDPFVQQTTEQAIVDLMPQLDSSNSGLQTAAIVVSPSNGDILAVVGDRLPSYAGFNRALDARRHIGSLIKPVIYLAALKHPEKYSLATLLDDTKLRIMGEDKKIWEPQNYDKIHHGKVILYEALLKSYNIPAARLGLELGLSEIVDTINELGSQQELPPYPSITLGAVDMSVYDVASIYQTFAANGFHSPLRSVVAVLDKDGRPLSRYGLEVERQIDPDAIALVNYSLQRITELGTASRLASELEIKVAGKTGTSDELRDSWFAGFSGDRVAVVWTGFDDNRASGLTGSSGAMRIWSRMMRDISSSSFEVELPDHIELHWIDRESGLLSGKQCENAIELPFIKGSEPVSHAECSAATTFDWFRSIFSN